MQQNKAQKVIEEVKKAFIGKTETRNNGFCNIPKKIKIQVWLSGGLMS